MRLTAAADLQGLQALLSRRVKTSDREAPGCHDIHKDGIPLPLQDPSEVLRQRLRREGTHPDAVIAADRPLAGGDIRRRITAPQLREYLISLLTLQKGPHLDLIDHRLHRVLPRERFFGHHHPHRAHPLLCKAQLVRGRAGQIDDAVLWIHIGTAICDLDLHLGVRLQVLHQDLSAQRERAMGRCEFVHREPLTTGRLAAVKAGPIPRRPAHLGA
jgi:hypothetical protein